MFFDKKAVPPYIAALRNVVPFMRDAWSNSPQILALLMVLRTLSAFLPLAALAVGGLLIDAINAARGTHLLTSRVLLLLVIEAFATLASVILTTALTHFDRLLTNQFSLRMNLQVLSYCNRLSLEVI